LLIGLKLGAGEVNRAAMDRIYTTAGMTPGAFAGARMTVAPIMAPPSATMVTGTASGSVGAAATVPPLAQRTGTPGPGSKLGGLFFAHQQATLTAEAARNIGTPIRGK